MNRLFDDEFCLRSERMNPFSKSRLQKNYGGGDIGLVGSAAIYAASAIASWAQALLVPGIQAAANLQLMSRQKSDYDKITAVQRSFLSTAIANYISGVDALLPEFQNALPSVPQAAQYIPVDACCVQGATIECNISHVERAAAWAVASDHHKNQHAIVRATVFDPNFLTNMAITSDQVLAALRGILPIGDVVDVVSDAAERAAMTGRIGNSRKSTLRDLGLSKMRMQALGREELRRHHAFVASSISSIGRVANIDDMMQTPQQRIALALTQAQLIQNSLQNLYNRNAQKEPYLLAQLQTKLQKVITKLQFEANKATLTNTFVPNYAAILQPAIRSVAGAIGDRIDPAMQNQFYGPPGAQQGFSTQQASQPGGANYDPASSARASDRPDNIFKDYGI